MAEASKSTTTRVLTFAGLVITVAAGGVGLLFTLKPALKPCIGGAEATFTGAPVFPNTPIKLFSEHTDAPVGSIPRSQKHDVGAEVRLSLRVENLRDEALQLRYSLVAIEPDDSLGAIDESIDKNEAVELTASTCSDVVGTDVFVKVQLDNRRKPKGRYRVILELYRGDDRTQRLALTQTPIFVD